MPGKKTINLQPLIDLGLSQTDADLLKTLPRELIWKKVSTTLLKNKPFSDQLAIFKLLFPYWPDDLESAPAWIPDKDSIKNTHIAEAMARLKITTYREFHGWSVNHFEKFWDYVIKQLKIVFKTPFSRICDLTDGLEFPRWLPDAKLNIIDSCFNASPTADAILFQDKNKKIQKISFQKLEELTNQIANSLVTIGFSENDAIAIDMPMTYFAVAIYLAIIKMGGVVVSIADSFSPEEIATRLRISNTKAIFTQDFIYRGDKKIPLYEKIIAANAPVAIVLSEENKLDLRSGDLSFENFLVDNKTFTSVERDPMDHCNILFSSGTTGEPKAIPWTHSTAIKAASDAFFHQNIHEGDVLAWPTNLGWMMGPWLIFAAFMNKAAVALYTDMPRERAFGEFIQNANVTMLGVVPTLVASWRQSHAMENLDWSAIKVFSSTGECSNPEDMLYLMHLAGYKPIIEYCGGTEIGGAFVTSTLIENNYPSVFTTPALGINFIIIDEAGNPTNNGEIALVPPSMGLSTELLNADHHKIYFEKMPKSREGKLLRRHGDQIQQFANLNYAILGRADDTMNLHAVKISSAEIERALSGIENIIETAAIAVSKAHGPSQLVIFAATEKILNKNHIMKIMQERINHHLNPLFKIEDVVFVAELPKTASNKIMRRMLRKQYQSV